ncbi:MAG: hypothetical protein QF898_19625 [SAR202 cluster bacterium]|jgi:hypothetical protein|nr:hypothetical protein [SAR202 cluster bacterium]MDP6513465.1 hypothetical protein [SAR202 cluster bacterium]MDP6714740.1 hypothetical protein [SAR202 cluster bacterium]
MSSKYQREIEEILEKSGDLGSSKPPRPQPEKESLFRLVGLYIKNALSGKLWSLSPGRVMLIGLLLLLSMLIVMQFVPGIPGLLAWAGLLIFIVGYGMVLAKPPKMEKRWRGQSMEPSGESLWDRLRRRIRPK